ncbi:MAG: DUF1365 domain-containing protein [Rhodothalassiaceae bacterium]
MTAARLYTGHVMHARLMPVRHRFRYRVFSLLLDLDRLNEVNGRLFKIDRPGLVSFRQSDHGDGRGDLAAWARAQFGDIATDTVRLFCFPRIFGYVFNPIAIFFAYDAQDRLSGMLYQVTNTFGDRHSYRIASGEGPVRQQVAKALHVSPFNPMGGGYRFRLAGPDARFSLSIVQHDAARRDILVAVHQAQAERFSEARLARRLLSHPLMTFKVTAGIHLEAVKLFAKGLRYHRRPHAPLEPVSTGRVNKLQKYHQTEGEVTG